MKIAVASSGLGHVARGVETWAEDLGRSLVGRGHSVLLIKGGGAAVEKYERIVPCWQREQPRTLRLSRWVPRWLGWRLGLGSPYEIEQISFAINIIGLLKREHVDILHVQDPLVGLVIQRAKRLGMLQTCVVLANGTDEPGDFLLKFDYVQHLAEWHRDQARAVGACRESWRTIPNFVDTDRFYPGQSLRVRDELAIPHDALIVLSAAAIRRAHKRVDYLIDEFARLRADHPDLPVYLVVAGGWEADTDDLVRDGLQRLGHRVRFLVRYPRDQMPDLYRAADLFVLCSRMEMLGIVLLEAAATGLPSLVCPHPVLRWVTGPGGEAVAMENPGDLARSLASLLGDRSRRVSLGGLARQHCLANFAREPVIDQILGFYRDILSSKNCSAPTHLRASI